MEKSFKIEKKKKHKPYSVTKMCSYNLIALAHTEHDRSTQRTVIISYHEKKEKK